MKKEFSFVLLSCMMCGSGAGFAQSRSGSSYLNYMDENYVNKPSSPAFAVVQEETEENDDVVVVPEQVGYVQVDRYKNAKAGVDSKKTLNKDGKVVDGDASGDKNKNNGDGFVGGLLRDCYLQFSVGKSKLNKYTLSQQNTALIMEYDWGSLGKVKMKPDEDSTIVGVEFGIGYNRWQLGFEAEKVNFNKVSATDANKEFLMNYNHHIDIMSAGFVMSYNLADTSSFFVPFIGAGVGQAQFKLYDFGQVWSKGGVVVSSDTEGASASVFRSGEEKIKTTYIKAIVGFSTDVKFARLVLSADYRIFDEMESGGALKFKDLSMFNSKVALKFNF